MDPHGATTRLVSALAKGITDPGMAGEHADLAADALHEVLGERASLVLEARFTGFYRDDALVGPVDPTITRAAARLVILRIDRIGFTAEAESEDVRLLLDAVTEEGGREGPSITDRLAELAPRGIYVGLKTGEVYRPFRPVEAPKSESGPVARSDVQDDLPPESPSLDELEILEEPPDHPPTPAGREDVPAATSASVGRGEEEPEAAGGGASEGLFQFFRSTDAAETSASEEELATDLAAARDLSEYDSLCQASEAAIREWSARDETERILPIAIALGREATRTDRTRIYRETAAKALRASLDREVLRALIELAEVAPPDRRAELLTAFIVIGRRGAEFLLKSMMRSRDPATRADIFQALRASGRTVTEMLDHALETGGPTAVSRMVAAARTDAPEDLREALLWLKALADHENPRVRHQVATSIAEFDDPIRIRVLLRLMDDEAPEVRQAAVEALGTAGDPSAAPFLLRATDGDDEPVAVAAITSLGRMRATDAVPGLERIVKSRSWFGRERRRDRKTAAVRALGRIGGEAARRALEAAARSRDDRVATEASEVLRRSANEADAPES